MPSDRELQRYCKGYYEARIRENHDDRHVINIIFVPYHGKVKDVFTARLS
jgi:hypothetical protein